MTSFAYSNWIRPLYFRISEVLTCRYRLKISYFNTRDNLVSWICIRFKRVSPANNRKKEIKAFCYYFVVQWYSIHLHAIEPIRLHSSLTSWSQPSARHESKPNNNKSSDSNPMDVLTYRTLTSQCCMTKSGSVLKIDLTVSELSLLFTSPKLRDIRGLHLTGCRF